MDVKEINQILKSIYDKETTTKEEKKAILEAGGCVWRARMNKVVNEASFMNMLYEYMAYKYDVEVETTETETVFYVKTFMKDKEE